MGFLKNVKKSIDDYLEKTAKSNKEMFGDGVPDCCKMNNQVSRQQGKSKND